MNEYTRINLNRPLLVIRAPKGILACGYVSMETCEKLGDACAIVTGVDDFDDMLAAAVQRVSSAARELGVREGMTGAAALELFA